MKLNHLNLTVTDVPAARAFLEKYFDLKPLEGARDNRNFTILTDDNGMVLTLMGAGKKDVTYPPNFHIGFIQESEERVNEINRRMKEDGFDVKPPERQHAWTFYVDAPGGI